MTIQSYLDTLNLRYKTGISREHTYRGDLQTLLMSILPDILVTNEPARVACGAPDYMLTRKDVPVGYIEAKDIGVDLHAKILKEQFDRYKSGLSNLIFTDYLDFHFYKDGVFTTSVSIAKIENGAIIPIPANFEAFEGLIKNFALTISQTIKSPTKLAEMMAGKAKLMADIIEKSLNFDDENDTLSSLKKQMLSFKQMLIHDIDNKAFSDIYAQTIAYGMFAARYHDPTLPTFSRQEAATLIPKSNPFLRKLFQDIAGYDLDDRLVWIVDELVNIFLATDVAVIMRNFGKSTKQEDPVVHFYETFLAAYNPALRKARGVWYTPQPVVNFIVRAVDDILKTEFDLPNGLADNSKINHPSPSKGGELVHKVQILDPATGTGTFLAEVVRHIYKNFEGQLGIWSNYVNQHLIPRLNGFELLMASYAMAHLKMDMLLTETGYKATTDQRFRIFLTNSLEEAHPDSATLFSSWLSDEAEQANAIKRDTKVMVIIGNPPYSGESANKGEWIMKLMEDYKKEPGGKVKLKEKNSKWINDDYVKFLRYGQHFIEKAGEGILAFINPHGFLDNPTFRGMRWNLLKTYDKIYTIDLHGNSKKKEKHPDGSVDVNVFDIMQGVSINLFIKTGEKETDALARVFHFDLLGKRDLKYDFLLSNNIKSIPYKEITMIAPDYIMNQNDFSLKVQYEQGFLLNDLFLLNGNGIVSKRDSMAFQDSKDKIRDIIVDILRSSNEDIKQKYNDVSWESRDGKVEYVKQNVMDFGTDDKLFVQCEYRPFDKKWTYYTGKSKGFIGWPVKQIMNNFLSGENIGLIIGRQGQAVGSMQWNLCFITKHITDFNLYYRGGGMSFPLYLYPETNAQQSIETTPPLGHPSKGGEFRTPNLNAEIVKKIAEKLGLTFTPEKFPSLGGVAASRGGESTGGVADNQRGESTGGIAENQSGENTVEVAENQRGENTGGVPENQSGFSSKEVATPQGGRNTKNYMNLPYNPKLKERARELRQAGNLSEVLFWNQVKNKQFKGYDFDRQKIVGNYIVDFYCSNCNVVIEIDGSSHDDKQEYDAERDAFLESLGLTVIHIPVSDIFNRMSAVMNMLFDHPTLKGTPPKEGKKEGNFAPIDILDYIYAVLHSPSYREKYKEFLKIDFPRVPYPKAPSPSERAGGEAFWQLVKLGGELRQIHLLESPEVNKYITEYPIDGNNIVSKIKYEENYEIINGDTITFMDPVYSMGRVYINETQYFQMVPEVAWNFYIGGYQPAQKWLKDRKGRELGFEDILHYQKIIVALERTDELMKEIDKVFTIA